MFQLEISGINTGSVPRRPFQAFFFNLSTAGVDPGERHNGPCPHLNGDLRNLATYRNSVLLKRFQDSAASLDD